MKKFVAPGNPSSTPTGKKNDKSPTSGAKKSAGFPDGRVADMGRQKSPGKDGKGIR
jgi:hypothetical protein